MKLRYTDRSRDDVELAFAWYERQRRGLGLEFLNCVDAKSLPTSLYKGRNYPSLAKRGEGEIFRYTHQFNFGLCSKVT